MTRQILTGYEAPSVPELEQRIRLLEVRLATLTEAVQALTAGLEGTPLDGPGSDDVAAAARRAHEILLAPAHH